MRRPPPHVQRGVRLALAVFIACLIGYGVVLPRGTSTQRTAFPKPSVYKLCCLRFVYAQAFTIITSDSGCRASSGAPSHVWYEKRLCLAVVSFTPKPWAKLHSLLLQVVSAPVIGKVSQVGIERVLGTIIGGLTGYAVYILGSLVWNTTTDGELMHMCCCSCS